MAIEDDDPRYAERFELFCTVLSWRMPLLS